MTTHMECQVTGNQNKNLLRYIIIGCANDHRKSLNALISASLKIKTFKLIAAVLNGSFDYVLS